MRLVSVYEVQSAADVLWDLLVERPTEANISHKQMPSWQAHVAFIASKPYAAWYLIELEPEHYIGAVYLTPQDEVGLGILKAWHHQGHGTAALLLLMVEHPRPRYLANVAPANLAGQQFWLKQGFKPLQVTYERTP
jgi:RimJ/RimL family protein N-acetyltransferase